MSVPSETRAVKVLEPPTRLVLVGVGGTGGYVLQQVARLLYAQHAVNGRTWPLVLIDGDVIEERNLRRQYFLPQDVGRNKASVLAERYGRAYGLEIAAYPHYLLDPDDLYPSGGPNVGPLREEGVLIGCVDNGQARRVMHDAATRMHQVTYIDSGNAAALEEDEFDRADRYDLHRAVNSGWEGQIVAGVRTENQQRIPFAGEVFPDLLTDDENQPRLGAGGAACGDEVVSNPQRLMTNVMAATCIMGYLHTLLVDGTIVNHRTFFDARKNFVRSDAAIRHVLQVNV